MNKNNPNGFEKGQFVYTSPSRRDQGGNKEIKSVGRKWAVLSDGNRFDLITMNVDGGGYTPPYSVFKTEEEYKLKNEIATQWSSLQKKFSHAYSPPKNMTLEKILKLKEILEVQE